MKDIKADDIITILEKFRDDRDWQQFHTLKNLVSGLNVEAGELLEHFIWGDLNKMDEKKSKEVSKEVADVFIYLLLIAKKLDIDLTEITHNKIKENKEKYPTEKVKGSSKKYNEY